MINGVEQPGLLLAGLAQLLDLLEMLADETHFASECAQRCGNSGDAQVAENGVTVLDGLDTAKRSVEERSQIIFVTAGHDAIDDLIDVEICEVRRLAGYLFMVGFSLEQDAK